MIEEEIKMKGNTWKKIFCYLVVAAILVVLIYGIYMLVRKSNEQLVFSDTVATIREAPHNPANDYQHQNSFADIVLGAVNGNMYFASIGEYNFVGESEYAYWLTALEKTGPRKLHKVMNQVLTICNGYCYYLEWDKTTRENYLYAYNLMTEATSKVVAWDKSLNYIENYWFVEDETLYLQISPDEELYYPVTGTDVGAPVKKAVYVAQNGYYTVIKGAAYFCDNRGERQKVDIPERWEMTRLIPCTEGVLLHNDGAQCPLYLIESDSVDLIPLFEMECDFSCTAMNVYGDYAYLSVLRYKDHSDVWDYKRYENDSVEGTYRIDLQDYTVEKLNDHIFDSLYIFDGTGIFAVRDDGTVYKMDFDGKIQQIVIGRSDNFYRSRY